MFLEGALMHICSPNFCDWCPVDEPPNHLSDSQRVWFHESHRNVARKLAILNRCKSNPLLWLQQHRGNTKMFISSLSLKGAQLLTSPVAECPGFKQSASRCWLQSSPLGHWWVFAHPQLLRGTKNKEGDLYNHKGVRDNQELRPGWWMKFIS